MFRKHRKFSLLVEVLEIFFGCPILILVSSGSSDMVSPGDWLVSSISFLLSTRLLGILRWGKTASLCRVVRAVFHQAAAGLPFSCSSSPSKVGKFSFECCLLSQRSVLGSTIWSALGGWPVTTLLLSAFMPLLISAGCWQLLWEVDLLTCSCSQPLLLYPC
jgi:hypothetical protein